MHPPGQIISTVREVVFNTPRFSCFSDCGRYYATVVRSHGNPASRLFDVRIHDTSTHTICCVVHEEQDSPETFRLSPDQRILAIDSVYSSIYEWPSGKLLNRPQKYELYQTWTVVNSNGSRYAIVDSRNASIHNVGNEPKGSTFRSRTLLGIDRILEVYFDSKDQPKALVLTGGIIEQWDIASNNRDWNSAETDQIGKGGSPLPDPDQWILISPDKETFVSFHHVLGVCKRSLSDGRVVNLILAMKIDRVSSTIPATGRTLCGLPESPGARLGKSDSTILTKDQEVDGGVRIPKQPVREPYRTSSPGFALRPGLARNQHCPAGKPFALISRL